eukprot:2050989-Amphidinium_carterae.1
MPVALRATPLEGDQLTQEDEITVSSVCTLHTVWTHWRVVPPHSIVECASNLNDNRSSGSRSIASD